MSELLQQALFFAAVSLVAVACLAAAFLAGVLYERWSERRALQRAAQQFSTLVERLLKNLDQAADFTGQLQQFPAADWQAGQQATLCAKAGELLNRLIEFSTPPEVRQAQLERQVPAVQFPTLVRSPEDARTGLPDYSAFEVNLRSTLDCVATGLFATVVLVEIDKFAALVTRHGPREADHFCRSVAKLLLHGVRDQDLVCQCFDGRFAVLLLDAQAEPLEAIPGELRDLIRQHRFRLSSTDQEVLVTASFGVYAPQPGDQPAICLTRVQHALDDSQRRGRNQLHRHDGRTSVFCRAG